MEHDDGLLLSRVEDAFDAAKRQAVRFLDFLDVREQAVVSRAVSAHREGGACFFGGYEGAERQMLGVFPPRTRPDPARFPIQPVRITWKGDAPTHRDFLGALLALGIRREKLGDILVGGDACVVLCERAIASFVLADLSRVGRAGVSCEPCAAEGLRREEHFAPIGGTVASARLDCVVGALLNRSRAEVQRMLAAGLVEVDFAPAAEGARTVAEGASLSIRGEGRFVLDELGPPTRKGRLRFAARRYV